MRMLLKAMAFWVWGLIAIALSASFVTVSFRLLSNHRWHDSAISPSQSTHADSASVPATVDSSDETMPKAGAVSRSIAKEIRAAQGALRLRQWQGALENLAAAERISPLTAFDLKTIDDFKAYAYLGLKNFNGAQSSYEAELATGAVTVQETVNVFRMLFRLSASNGQHAKAIENGTALAARGGASAEDLGIVSQIYYLQKDCTNSVVWANRAIAASRKAGQAPKENWSQFKLQCAADAGDTAAIAAALTDLIRLTHKSTYWNTLLRLERQDERDDHNTLMLYRVMYDTASMSAGSDYIEMAQLLGDAALAAEAQTVLEKAMSSGIILEQQKERTGRLLNSFKTRVDADRQNYVRRDAEAVENPAGELGVKLGEVHYGLGEYPDAVAILNRSLTKDQVQHLDDAYVYLGRSLVALKEVDGARAAFANLKTIPNISPRVLRLWNLYAETLVEFHAQTAPIDAADYNRGDSPTN
jgi:tetratricopeptide (TPR) repeat protein